MFEGFVVIIKLSERLWGQTERYITYVDMLPGIVFVESFDLTKLNRDLKLLRKICLQGHLLIVPADN